MSSPPQTTPIRGPKEDLLQTQASQQLQLPQPIVPEVNNPLEIILTRLDKLEKRIMTVEKSNAPSILNNSPSLLWNNNNKNQGNPNVSAVNIPQNQVQRIEKLKGKFKLRK